AGLEEVSGGRVHIGDEDVTTRLPQERDVAMVFQSYALYPHMRVRDNLAFGLKMRRTPRERIRERVAWAADVLGLEELLDRRPGQLSGGQRQRVALGRALVREPAVFLFDEPLSNLDARLRLEMRDEIAALHRRLDATVIFVTHDQVEAMSLGERIAVLRDGRLHQVGPPLEVYTEPADLFVARFIGSPVINTLEGSLGHDGGGPVFLGADGLTLAGSGEGLEPADLGDGQGDGPVVLGIRPEALEVTAPDAPGVHRVQEVRRREALGSELLLHLDGPGDPPWVARVPPDHAARAGEAVGLRLDGDRAHLFDTVSGRRIGVLGRRRVEP
ncbi:MAG TPA: ATP-binding cassette domain-containing protein, partial [Longimicrobiales bacterium]|nr:ATP-binding cassette domain-containing protein [Longimicrobiales bacterium]